MNDAGLAAGCGRCHRLRGVGTADRLLGVAKRDEHRAGGDALAIGVAPLVSFRIILLVGIAVAIASMWSMLYRPEPAQPRASS